MMRLICALFLSCALFAEGHYEFSKEQVLDYYHGVESDLSDLEPILSNGFMDGAENVLDVGCGDGKLTALVAKAFPEKKIVGCDISVNMIKFAQEKFPAAEYPNLSFVVKDACDLNYASEFDRVVSFSSLHWIKDQKVALRSIYEALKPGGKVYIRATPKSSNNDYKTICMKVIMSFKWMTQFMGYKSDSSFHSERDYKKILTSVGFHVDHMEQKNHETVIKDRAAFNTFIRGVLTLLTHLPENKRGAFIDDYYDELVSYGNVDEQGAVHFYFDRVEMMLSKI